MRLPLSLCLLSACAPDLSERLGQDTHSPAVDEQIDGDVVITTIDATSEEAWVHYDLSTGGLAAPGEPWHLAFRRFHVDLADGMEALALDGVALDAVDPDTSSAEGWRADAPDADDDGVPEYALAGWYDYDVESHLLTAKDRTWVLRDTSEAAWALRFDSYYDEAGTPARLTFRWKRLTGEP